MKKIVALGGAALLAACSASLPPPELVDARAAYAKATTGATVAPQEFLAARTALDRAEQSFREHGDTPSARTLAYVAARKAQTAEVAARVALHKTTTREASEAIGRIDHSRLREGARAPRDTGEALVYTAGALARSNERHTEASAAATESLDRLRRVVRIKDQGDGFIVKLSAALLFDGKDNRHVDEGAKAKLDAVARVLSRAVPNAQIRVESHADSGGGGDSYDRTIAQWRADAVADYLASQGVPRARITPVGYAPRHFSREAANYELRGLDRRVDIVVTKPVVLATSP